VAKSEPPEALDTTEKSSLEGYLDTIGFAGTQFLVTSLPPDRLYLDAEVYYDGQYASTIEASVIESLETYMSSLPFDGIVKITSVEDAIQSVVGVTDVVINNLGVRVSTLACPGGVQWMVENNENVLRRIELYSGYIIQEDTTNYTFSDLLTFTPET
jgi:hypothetical protein